MFRWDGQRAAGHGGMKQSDGMAGFMDGWTDICWTTGRAVGGPEVISRSP